MQKHVQKRIGTALRNLSQKSDKPLGGKGSITKALIAKFAGYYRWAKKNKGNDVDAVKGAVMATLYHMTSADENPKHSICPTQGSWGNDRATTKTQVLPVYKCLSRHSLHAAWLLRSTEGTERNRKQMIERRCTCGVSLHYIFTAPHAAAPRLTATESTPPAKATVASHTAVLDPTGILCSASGA